MKKLATFIVLIVLALLGYVEQDDIDSWLANESVTANDTEAANNTEAAKPDVSPKTPAAQASDDETIQAAFERKRNDVQVSGAGTVIKTLADDNEGSRHQRFILQLDSGLTLLFAHNIDLAPRVANLKQGDRLAFYGEYEWSDQGGVIHWTHHDPQGRHPNGWLKHAGKTYQ